VVDHPLVSVVIPAYNSAAYTVETVESVLAQTYRDLEVIVVDDGSTDSTREALAPYVGRVQYIYKDNGGACSARNEGIRHAKGEYLACLDCDDLWLPDKLECSLPVLEQDPEMGFVCTPCYIIGSSGEHLGETRYPFDRDNAYMNLLAENYVLAPTVVMRRSCLDHVGHFDESIFIPADWDLWLRLACRFRVGYVERPLSKYRLASNYTLRHADKFVREADYVLEKQLRAAPQLSPRAQDRLRSRLQLTHALLYLKAGNPPGARRVLRRAIAIHPLNWRAYGYLLLAFLGSRVCRLAVALRRNA
jgi:glycosyltransferase involved in cell wall biosynthesis